MIDSMSMKKPRSVNETPGLEFGDLVLRRFGATVPGFAQTRHMDCNIQCFWKIGRVHAACLMSQEPDLRKCFSATETHGLTRLHGLVHAAMEDVHARIWVGPSVAKGGGIEIAQVLLHLGNDQKMRPFGNQKPYGELNRRHVIDQSEAREEPKEV